MINEDIIEFSLILLLLTLIFLSYSDIEVNLWKFKISLKRNTKSSKEIQQIKQEVERQRLEFQSQLFTLKKEAILTELKMTGLILTLREKATKNYIENRFFKEINEAIDNNSAPLPNEDKIPKENSHSPINIENFDWGEIKHYKP